MEKLPSPNNNPVKILNTLSNIFNDYRYLYPLASVVILSGGSVGFAIKMETVQFWHVLVYFVVVLIILIWAPTKLPTSPVSKGLTGFDRTEEALQIRLLGRDAPNIWENFDGIYNAFNAPWQLETLGNTENYVKIHTKRYGNKELAKCRYLYYYRSDEEKDLRDLLKRLEPFIAFEARVFLNLSESDTRSNRFPDILAEKMKSNPKQGHADKLELYLVKDEAPQLTFFHGTKAGVGTSILYFNVGPFMDDGHPNKVLYSTDPEFSGRLGDYFHKELAKADVHRYAGMDIFGFFIDMAKKFGNEPQEPPVG